MTASKSTAGAKRLPRHVLQELGFSVHRADEALVGHAVVVPQMWIPKTAVLRTSILAIWADALAGLIAMDVVRPRVPVTLQLDVQVYRPMADVGEVKARARLVKAGQAVVVSRIDFTDQNDEPLAAAAALFMVNADPRVTMPDVDVVARMGEPGGPLKVPFAARVGCTRQAAGIAVLPRIPEGLNASGTINGGLLALVVEEAALSLQAPGESLTTLTLRYLRPVRRGPAVASAVFSNGLGEISVVDEGRDDALAVQATVRTHVSDAVEMVEPMRLPA